MSLSNQKFLFIDCQTTGTSPANGQIIEIAWSVCSASEAEPTIHSWLIALPEGRTLPAITTEITGLTDHDMKNALPAEEVKKKFSEALEGAPVSLIHYAQFEKTFLKAFLTGENEQDELFEILCTSRLAKKLVPSIPNFNIRGVAGYYGMAYHELRRASDHVRATILIWRGLLQELDKKEMTSLDHVRALLGEKSKPKTKPKFEFRITREFRLALPDRPGIYKMKDKTGKILYVGKATSLYDRVNSYFRGQTGRDKRKLQMLAQTWEMDIQECQSALEAAVTETDEIKKWDPPYNVSLKGGRRELAFYNRNFDSVSLEQDDEHTVGPFSLTNSIEEVKWLMDWRAGRGALTRIFYGLYEHEELEAGFKVFLERHPLDFENMSIRSHLAFGFYLWREEIALEKASAADDDVEEETLGEVEDSDAEEVLTPDDIADKFERVYMRAAKTLHRAKALTRLLNSNVDWEENKTLYRLAVRNGYLIREQEPDKDVSREAWADKTLDDYDRMSVLYSEIKNRGGHIRFI